MDLSVVIPCYNEEKGVASAIERTCTALRRLGISFELIIVNDGSKDDTLRVAEEAARQFPETRVLSHTPNRGASRANWRGLEEARGDVVMHNGADLPFDPADTKVVLDAIADGADVVVVERAHREAYGLVRKVVSWGNVTVLRTLFGTPYHDHNFVQGYRRDVLRDVRPITFGISTLTPELIIRAIRKGYRVVSVTCEYHKRDTGKSSIRTKNVVEAVTNLSRLWWALRREGQ